MGKFYSDDEVKKLESEGKVKKNFISDEEMAAIEADKPKMGFIESQVEALPIYGAAIGGVAGLPAAPATFGLSSVAGSALGAGGGQSLRDIIKRNFYSEKPKTTADVFMSPLKAMAEGATSEMGGQILGKGLQYGIGKIGKELKEGRVIADVLESPKPIDTPEIKVDAPEIKISGGGAELEQSGQLFEYKAPQSVKDFENYNPPVEDGHLFSYDRLKEIESTLDLTHPPTNYHYSMLENPKAMKERKLLFENLPTKPVQKIATYGQNMIKDAESNVLKAVENISGQQPKSIRDSGSNFINNVDSKRKAVKESLSPVFEEMNKKSINLTDKNTQDLIRTIGKETEVGSLLREVAEPIMQDGKVVGQKIKLKLSPNSPKTGLHENEYKAISEVIDSLNDGASFKEVQRIRDFLRKAKDPINTAANEEIEKVRKILLNSLETMTPVNVQPIMKEYAINELAFDNIEKIIGGKTSAFNPKHLANPDDVVEKIFSNPNNVEIVRSYLGDNAVNELLSTKVNEGVLKSFDSATGFNPTTLKQWLKTNRNFVTNYVPREIAEKINAGADYGFLAKRFLDEVNPSGTAASLKAMIEPKGLINKLKQGQFTGAVTGAAAEKIGGAFEQRQALSKLDEILRGVQDLKPKQTPSVTSRLFPLTEQTAVPLAERAGQSLLMTEQNRNPISRRLQQLKGGK